MHTHYITKRGLALLHKEQEELLSRRPVAVEHLKRARELGDLSENGYYKASRAKLSFIDGRLARLKMMIKTAVVKEAVGNTHITIGNTVTIGNDFSKKVYTVVGRFESNPSEGKISDISPIGKALLDKKVGDTIVVNTPKGEMKYRILAITSSS